MDALARIGLFIALVRKQLGREALARVGLYTLAVLATLALLVPLAAAMLALHHSALLAWLGLFAAVAVLLTGILLGVVAPRRRWRNDWHVARYVGHQQPAVASDLLSAVELGASDIDRTASSRHISKDLVRALLDHTARRLEGVEPRTLVPTTRVRRARAVCGVMVAAHLAAIVVAHEDLGRGWARVLDPSDPRPFGGAAMSEKPLVGDLEITLHYPAYTGRPPAMLPSSSGEFRALPGTMVTLQTTALVPAARARMLMDTAVGAPPDEDAAGAAEAAKAARTGATQATAPESAADSMPGAAGDSTPEAALDSTSGAATEGTPAVPEAPGAEDPEALGAEADEEDDTQPGAMISTEIPMEVSGRSLTVRFPVQSAARYRFLIESATGQRWVETTPRQIELELDRAPEVQLYTPGDELDVTSMKRIELAYIAEDDYGISKIELVWQDRGKEQRKALPLAEGQRSAQGKFFWDLVELPLEPGVTVSYHVEVADNDTVTGPNIGKSKQFTLRVFSPREKHEALVARQRELFEKLLATLGARLTVAAEDVAAHAALQRDTAALVVELGTLVAALETDELADADLRKALGEMSGRLDKLAKAEAALLTQLSAKQQQGTATKQIAARLAASNAEQVAELEDDVILLANWLDRQQMENLLAINDEIKVHQDRLKELFKEYERTGSAELLAEIEREVRSLQKRLAELAEERSTMAEDVLDRFVNAEALEDDQAADCMSQVRELLARGDAQGAQNKLAECMKTLDDAAAAMEQALRDLRGDAFSEEERKLGEMMDKLTDLAQDQEEIAQAADEIWNRYAERVDEMMREDAKETRKQAARLLDRLRKQLGRIPDTGLTEFAKEELEIVEARLADVERMLNDGDIAEALAMARQAEQGLETMAAELEAAMLDEQDQPWSDRTVEAQREVGRSQPLARKLVEELEASTPSPREIMTPEDRRELDRLRRRQQAAGDRARKLAERVRQLGSDLPGRAGEAMAQGVDEAQGQMGRASERMRVQDPSGARQETRGAAEALRRTLESAQNAARGRQAAGQAGLRDEPIRIPGADEYKAPEKFREDILEAMKREKAPEGFGDLVKRYYEELIR